jgi:hypothetical protein
MHLRLVPDWRHFPWPSVQQPIDAELKLTVVPLPKLASAIAWRFGHGMQPVKGREQLAGIGYGEGDAIMMPAPFARRSRLWPVADPHPAARRGWRGLPHVRAES